MAMFRLEPDAAEMRASGERILDIIIRTFEQLAEREMLQTPGDDMFDRVEYLVPERAKGLSRFFRGKATSLAGQEKHVGFGEGAFAVAPGNFFVDDGGAAVAIDAPHCVQKENENSPQGDKLKAPLGELVVAGGGAGSGI